MTQYRISEGAALLGVSDDTVRRWIDTGRLAAQKDQGGRMTVSGVDLAAIARGEGPDEIGRNKSSARNRFVGLVTRVEREGLVGIVEIQAGPHRIISMVTADAITDLGLTPGARAVASIKSTNVVIETA
ncbi:MAG: MerR family transcriptional regulator [Actinobacteria bacterium]|nr:MAG: MerR family transcriptional regulator [Actinomycetota bacterium]